MRRIKKQFDFTKVTGIDAESGEVLFTAMESGKVTKAKIAKDYFKDNDYLPLKIELEEVKEVRVMSGEFFYENSELIEDLETEDSETED